MHRRPLRWTLVLLLTAYGLCAQTQAPTTGSVVGTVVNDTTGKPIAGARVKLTATGDADPLYTRTDAEGRFEFANLTPGGYMLWAQSPGISWRDEFFHVTVTPGEPRSMTTLTLRPYGVIFGRLTDFSGTPIANVQVEVLHKRPASPNEGPSALIHPLPGSRDVLAERFAGTTDDRGRFRIARLVPGTYYLVAGKSPGLGIWEDPTNHTTYYPHALDLASAKPLDIAAGQQLHADLQIIHETGVRVAGRVVKPADVADSLPDSAFTNIMLVPEKSYLVNPNSPSAVSFLDRFELTGISPGKYRLQAVTFVRQNVWSGIPTPVLTATQRIEVADQDIEGVEVQLQPTRALPGTVSFPKNCSAVPIRIRAYGSGPMFSQPEAISGMDGSFVLTGLLPTQFRLDVSAASATSGAVTVVSARLGDRDVLKEGFDYPFADGAALRIVMGCAAGGEAQ